jgi:hypothetical protein
LKEWRIKMFLMIIISQKMIIIIVTAVETSNLTKNVPASNVLKHCLLVLVEVRLKKGKALQSEEGKLLGSGLCYVQRSQEFLMNNV